MGSFRNITHILYDNSLKHNLCYLRNILLDVPVAGSDGILHFSLRYVGSVSRFFFIHFLKSVVSKSRRLPRRLYTAVRFVILNRVTPCVLLTRRLSEY